MRLIYIDLLELGGGRQDSNPEGCYTLLVFKTSAFNRSAISPAREFDELESQHKVMLACSSELWLHTLVRVANTRPVRILGRIVRKMSRGRGVKKGTDHYCRVIWASSRLLVLLLPACDDKTMVITTSMVKVAVRSG